MWTTFLRDTVLQPLYEFILPPVCLACGGAVSQGSMVLCPLCSRTLYRVPPDDPLYQQTRARVMSAPGVAGLSVLYRFEHDGCLQSLLHQMKYRGMTRVGVECGKRLGEVVAGRIGTTPPLGVIPIPLHKTKLRERGYNQSEYIARGIASVLNIPVLSRTLQRHRHTESQTTLSREERQQNVADAFSVRPRAVPLVRGQTHLLVDDVITTGATLREAARALAVAGAQPSLVCAIGIAL